MSATKTKITYTTSGAKSWIPLDHKITPFNVAFHSDVTGTLAYQIEGTMDDVNDPNETVAVTSTLQASGAVDALGATTAPIRAMRVNITALDAGASLVFRVLQAGPGL